MFKFYPELRGVPTLDAGTLSNLRVTDNDDSAEAIDSALTIDTNTDGPKATIVKTPDINSDTLTAGDATFLSANNTTSAYIAFDAEL